MRIRLGHCFFEKNKGVNKEIVLDSSALINSNVLLLGSSGVGKSHTLKSMINQGSSTDPEVRFHVFDVHGDLDAKNSSNVEFSSVSPYGLNPFKVNPDYKFGGVNRSIQNFIRILDQASSTPLGTKQQSVLRNLITDVYADFGFFQNDPKSWSVNEAEAWVVGGGRSNRIYLDVSIADKDKVKALGARWDNDRTCWWTFTENYKGDLTKWKPKFKQRRYPVLKDVLEYAKQIHLERFLGSDQISIRHLQSLNKHAQSMQKRLLEAAKHHRLHDTAISGDDLLDKAKESAIDAFTSYVQNIQTGLELDSLLKYDSPQVLKSVIDRLENLELTGIFKSQMPPFNEDLPVWTYRLEALGLEEKKMMTLFLLQELFTLACQKGPTDRIRDIVVLDELSTYTSSQDDSGEGMIGVIARQARKFGLAIWAADQTPTGVPEVLISNVGAKILLGLDERFWNQSVTKLGIDLKLLKWVQPRVGIAVQLKEKNNMKSRWWWTLLNQS